MREIIAADVDRTWQEYDFFKRPAVQEAMTTVLYLWGRENTEFCYKQGMNEILAIVFIVFHSERLFEAEPKDWESLSDKEIAQNHLGEFLFDPEFTVADAFFVYEKILSCGVQSFYEDYIPYPVASNLVEDF